LRVERPDNASEIGVWARPAAAILAPRKERLFRGIVHPLLFFQNNAGMRNVSKRLDDLELEHFLVENTRIIHFGFHEPTNALQCRGIQMLYRKTQL